MFRVAWLSCEERTRYLSAAQQIAKLGCVAVFTQGDTPYVSSATYNAWGAVTELLVEGALQADFAAHFDNMWANPGWQLLRSSVPYIFMMADDHEWPGDNWDHTIGAGNTGGTPGGYTTHAQIIADHWEATKAWLAMVSEYADNPTNTDPLALPELPPEIVEAAPETPVTQYPARYYRVGFDVSGNLTTSNPIAEFFALDCISHRSPFKPHADPVPLATVGATMLGAHQKAWLLAQLAASSATFKPIMSPKKTYTGFGGNTDTFGNNYTVERDELVTAIHAASGWAVPGGCPWLVGDQHTPHVITRETASGADIDHIMVCACPVSVELNAAQGTVGGNNRWVSFRDRVFGVAEIDADRMDITIRSASNGAILWGPYRILPGQNIGSYVRPRLAIG